MESLSCVLILAFRARFGAMTCSDITLLCASLRCILYALDFFAARVSTTHDDSLDLYMDFRDYAYAWPHFLAISYVSGIVFCSAIGFDPRNLLRFFLLPSTYHYCHLSVLHRYTAVYNSTQRNCNRVAFTLYTNI